MYREQVGIELKQFHRLYNAVQSFLEESDTENLLELKRVWEGIA